MLCSMCYVVCVVLCVICSVLHVVCLGLEYGLLFFDLNFELG